ncbi:hypothetical protein B0H66DRAFT_568412 [Apodospora peruviana]|uniref:NmrA-like domain-containing protein n=1 Tax=Apodospora peruviana TaxID=516989 RepID=A0AAE0HWY3_9PEZI|nr:hypothetical protein B0H66DRAFT_568412 [Apodospora peruviana]
MASNTLPTVFVCGATGSQGAALCRQLRVIGWNVHATVRDPHSQAAQALEAHGVKLTVGDWDNKEALATTMAGCDKLFLNLVPNFGDWDRERLHAQSILAIAKEVGVKQVVYSSAVTAHAPEKRSGMDPSHPIHKLFFMKNTIEGIMKRAAFDHWTILRPTFFMANFLQPKVRMYPDLAQTNTFKTAMMPDTLMDLIDHEDIARFALAAFGDPTRFDQQEIELFGEALTPGQVTERLSMAAGRDIKAEFYTDEEIKEQHGTNLMIEVQLSMRDSHRFVDAEKIKSFGIPLTTFRDFLERESKDAVKATDP